jgi:hypothetical protein
MSTPEQRVVLAKAGPETLSNFLRDGSQASSPTIPQNTFPNPGSSAGDQGPTYSQTNVRNELHVSMNPFVIARAHQVIEQARESLRAEAIQHVEAERGIARNESLAFAEQVHSEASRVVGESQSQVVQSQRGLNEIRGGFTSCPNGTP